MGIRTNKVSILEVEAIELIASLLSIHYVLIDNECGPFGVVGDTLADLAGFTVSIKISVLAWKGHGIPYWAELAKEVKKLFRCYVVAILWS